MRRGARRSLRSRFAPSGADTRAGRGYEPGPPLAKLSGSARERRNAYDPSAYDPENRAALDSTLMIWFRTARRPATIKTLDMARAALPLGECVAGGSASPRKRRPGVERKHGRRTEAAWGVETDENVMDPERSSQGESSLASCAVLSPCDSCQEARPRALPGIRGCSSES